MAQVFISYSSRDEKQALNIVKELEKAGISCWIACRDIPVGGSFPAEIPPAIRSCPVFMLLLSGASVQSDDVMSELCLAKRKYEKKKKLIVPLALEDLRLPDNFDYHLAAVQIRHSYHRNPQSVLQEVIGKIREVSPASAPAPVAAPAPKQPKPAPAAPVKPTTQQVQSKPVQPGKPQTAEQHYREAMELFNYGNNQEAISLFLKAAEQDHPGAQYMVGHCVHTGKSLYPLTGGAAEAIRWYTKAAKNGDAKAQNALGICYQYGDGVAKDLTQAIMWYRRSAAQGCEAAQKSLKRLHATTETVNLSDLSPKEIDELAESSGLPLATADNIPKSAVELARKLAAPRNTGPSAEECYRKGYALLNGKKYSDAVIWLRKAAEQGHCDAQYWLGTCYSDGNGVPQDYKESLKWFQKAAEQGDRYAQDRMGSIYRFGKGVPKDLKEARKWYEKAAAQGNESAKITLKYL